jgi:hypothetical protein
MSRAAALVTSLSRVDLFERPQRPWALTCNDNMEAA